MRAHIRIRHSRMNDNHNKPSTNGWDTYWQGAKDNDAFVAGGFSHPAFPALWARAADEFFAANNKIEPLILDIATGSGAVVEALTQAPAARMENVSCVDISAASIDGVTARFPDVTGIVADATDVPLDSDRFNLITSQFGVEYAGGAAIDEAIRLLAPGGSLLFLMHIRPGVLYSECGAAIDALQRARDSRFVDLSRSFFEAGFAAVRGGDRAPYEAAAKAMNPAIKTLEAILTEHGEHVAGDSIVALHSTVQDIHSRIQHYNPDDVMHWLDGMEIELPKHEARMNSMHEAALDADAFRSICDRLTDAGLTIDRAQASKVEGVELPIAWMLQATAPI